LRQAGAKQVALGGVEGGQLQVGRRVLHVGGQAVLHGVLTVNTLNWCTLRNSAVSGAGAAT
jgi:hypothetical protein